MKKIMGLVIILAALLLGGYYGMGLITERTIEKNVAIINQTNALFVDIDSYHRGWYTSTAVLNWRLHVPERVTKDQNGQTITVPAEDYKMQMPLTVYHGPIIFVDNTVKFGLGYARSQLQIPQPYAQKFDNQFTPDSIKPTLNLSLFVNYLNKSSFHIDLPKFKLIAKGTGDQFEWDGMDSNLTVSSNMQNIDGSFTIDGISLLKNKMKATLVKLSSDDDLHQTANGLYLGQASLTMPSFQIMENQQKILDVEQFSVRSSSDIENDLFNSHFQASLDKVTSLGKTYGPAVVELSLKNLDAQVLAQINAQANQIQQGTDRERQQALLAILPELPKLFSKGAQFEVSKLSFVVPEGKIEGNLLISLPTDSASNPFQLLQKVSGHGSLKVPQPLLKEMVTALVRQRQANESPLQQAMIQQMNNNAPPQDAQNPSTDAEAKSDHSTTSTPENNQAQPQTKETTSGEDAPTKPLTAAESEQQIQTQTDEKLSQMVQSGLLSLQGNEYVIDISLEAGQLTVNGKPFTSAMIQF